jgi:DNA-binding LacI/PurR family transcriptional regulator
MATIDDVARLAGVSKGTVSNVFSKKRPISREVTERVLAAARQLNYEPNHVARSLATRKTMIVGLKMPVSRNSTLSGFETQMIDSVTRECARHGYRVLLDTLPEQDDVTAFSSDPVDGVILLNPRQKDPRIERYMRIGIPLVVIGRPQPLTEDICFVDNNNEEMAAQVGEYLIGNGHRRVLFLNAFEDMTVASDRLRGLRKAFERHGIAFPDELVMYNSRKAYPNAADYGYRSVLDTYRAGDYTAVIADTDQVALGVLRAARELKVDIPGELSLIALSNDASVALETTPKLTTVELNVHRLGTEAAKLLIEKMNGSAEVRQKIIDARLILRESCSKRL